LIAEVAESAVTFSRTNDVLAAADRILGAICTRDTTNLIVEDEIPFDAWAYTVTVNVPNFTLRPLIMPFVASQVIPGGRSDPRKKMTDELDVNVIGVI
jgi:hypothetical protein